MSSLQAAPRSIPPLMPQYETSVSELEGLAAKIEQYLKDHNVDFSKLERPTTALARFKSIRQRAKTNPGVWNARTAGTPPLPVGYEIGCELRAALASLEMSESRLSRPVAAPVGRSQGEPEIVEVFKLPNTRFNLRYSRSENKEARAQGGFAQIFFGWDTRNGRKLALKRPQIGTEANYRVWRDTSQELRNWGMFNHPNVAVFMGTCMIDDHLMLVTPWADLGSLSSYVSTRGLGKVDILPLFARAVQGLDYLHFHNVIHGDFTGHNILVFSSGQVVVSDFGLCKPDPAVQTTSQTKSKGNAQYVAVEIWNGGPRSKEADVWALGMTISQVLRGGGKAQPFGVSFAEATQFYANLLLPRLRPEAPASVGTHTSHRKLWRLAEGCWDEDPSVRPSLPAICGFLGVPATVRQ